MAVSDLSDARLVVASAKFKFDLAMFRHRLLFWYDQNKRDLPWRRSKDPYRVWLSEVMLQQTLIAVVIPAYNAFLKELPDIYALANATVDTVRRLCRGLGYYRRFGFLKQAAERLSDGQKLVVWPKTFAEWCELPGVGDYTASAISSIAFDYPAAVVDGNVERLFCRLLDLQVPPNGVGLKPHFKKLATELLATDRPGDFNQALMEIGQRVCTLANPSCNACPLADFCLAKARATQHLAPQPKIKRDSVATDLHLYLHIDQGQVLLQERPAHAKFLKGTTGFLTAIKNQKGQIVGDGIELRRNSRTSYKLIGEVRHSITHHRLTVSVFVTTKKQPRFSGKWVSLKKAEEDLVANLDRKALQLARKNLFLSNPIRDL